MGDNFRLINLEVKVILLVMKFSFILWLIVTGYFSARNEATNLVHPKMNNQLASLGPSTLKEISSLIFRYFLNIYDALLTESRE